MVFKFFSYLKFILNSTNQHGVHSPFVFDLITKCFYAKTNVSDIKKYQDYRRSILRNNDEIEVVDFGARSKNFRSNKRIVKQIAKHTGINFRRVKLLIRILRYFKPKIILEFGASLGLGTTALHFGYPEALIEGCPNTATLSKNLFDKFSFKNINVITGEFSEGLSKIESKLDLVFFNGNHQKKATLTYFEYCLDYIHNDSIFIFDDIHRSKEMKEAWVEIKMHPDVRITIDTYQWGFVFFRREQEKEHFIIRI